MKTRIIGNECIDAAKYNNIFRIVVKNLPPECKYAMYFVGDYCGQSHQGTISVNINNIYDTDWFKRNNIPRCIVLKNICKCGQQWGSFDVIIYHN
jgi:hypothetical protein